MGPIAGMEVLKNIKISRIRAPVRTEKTYIPSVELRHSLSVCIFLNHKYDFDLSGFKMAFISTELKS